MAACNCMKIIYETHKNVTKYMQYALAKCATMEHSIYTVVELAVKLVMKLRSNLTKLYIMAFVDFLHCVSEKNAQILKRYSLNL